MNLWTWKYTISGTNRQKSIHFNEGLVGEGLFRVSYTKLFIVAQFISILATL